MIRTKLGRSAWGFAMLGLRLDRLVALACLTLLLLIPRAALSDADADKSVPNAEIVAPPAEAEFAACNRQSDRRCCGDHTDNKWDVGRERKAG